MAFRAQVFSGDLDESVRHEQLLLEGEIMRMLKLLDISINHQVCARCWVEAKRASPHTKAELPVMCRAYNAVQNKGIA